MFGRIIDEVLELAPEIYTNKKGKIIKKFNKSELYMRIEGFKEIEEDISSCDSNDKKLVVDYYEELDNKIIIHYK